LSEKRGSHPQSLVLLHRSRPQEATRLVRRHVEILVVVVVRPEPLCSRRGLVALSPIARGLVCRGRVKKKRWCLLNTLCGKSRADSSSRSPDFLVKQVRRKGLWPVAAQAGVATMNGRRGKYGLFFFARSLDRSLRRSRARTPVTSRRLLRTRRPAVVQGELGHQPALTERPIEVSAQVRGAGRARMVAIARWYGAHTHTTTAV